MLCNCPVQPMAHHARHDGLQDCCFIVLVCRYCESHSIIGQAGREWHTSLCCCIIEVEQIEKTRVECSSFACPTFRDCFNRSARPRLKAAASSSSRRNTLTLTPAALLPGWADQALFHVHLGSRSIFVLSLTETAPPGKHRM